MGSDGLTNESRRAIHAAGALLLENLTEWHRDIIGSGIYMGRRLESPLEQAFLLWWTAAASVWSTLGVLQVWPQVEIQADGRTYRIDFLVTTKSGSAQLLVELDGHEFHERTKDQVASRDERDRALSRAGWTILHFSGAEFYRAPMDALAEILSTLRLRQERIA